MRRHRHKRMRQHRHKRMRHHRHKRMLQHRPKRMRQRRLKFLSDFCQKLFDTKRSESIGYDNDILQIKMMSLNLKQCYVLSRVT
jgi:hypothetical protein